MMVLNNLINDAQTIFKKEIGKSSLTVAIYVDDSLNGHNDPSLYREFRRKFEERFKIKAQDQVDLFLCIRVKHDHVNRTIPISQQQYIEACLKTFGL